mmetsp:Transcript_38252/g.80492  ORF Transcript_38252/g.80492 Transcript_38252/m.80492 type:complete len:86 (+) Transcript_38252:976-1233(+)
MELLVTDNVFLDIFDMDSRWEASTSIEYGIKMLPLVLQQQRAGVDNRCLSSRSTRRRVLLLRNHNNAFVDNESLVFLCRFYINRN